MQKPWFIKKFDETSLDRDHFLLFHYLLSTSRRKRISRKKYVSDYFCEWHSQSYQIFGLSQSARKTLHFYEMYRCSHFTSFMVKFDYLFITDTLHDDKGKQLDVESTFSIVRFQE